MNEGPYGDYTGKTSDERWQSAELSKPLSANNWVEAERLVSTFGTELDASSEPEHRRCGRKFLRVHHHPSL